MEKGYLYGCGFSEGVGKFVVRVGKAEAKPSRGAVSKKTRENGDVEIILFSEFAFRLLCTELSYDLRTTLTRVGLDFASLLQRQKCYRPVF